MSDIWKKGFSFGFDPKACDSCSGKCCRGSTGFVWTTQNEVEKICDYLNLDQITVIQKYFDRVDGRHTLRERIEGNEYLCIFFDSEKECCSIYPARPQQCDDFPFWDRYRDNRDASLDQCPGIIDKETD